MRLADRLSALDESGVRALNRAATLHPWSANGASLAARWLAPAEVALLAILGLTGRPWAAGRTLGAVAAIYVVCDLIGAVWGRTRPFARHDDLLAHVDHPSKRSFPSRHVASAVAMALIALPIRPWIGRLMAVAALGLAVSRVATGLHYPSDIAGGAALGLLVGRLFRQPSRWER